MTRLPEMADFVQDTEGIARRLTQLREARGLSRRRLAFDLDVTDASVGFWERGRSAPSTLAIMKYAVYFGVTTDWILFGGEADDQ
jgi:transcriptional regulator with XRE-family HTH domain